jgi:hypothetical protein
MCSEIKDTMYEDKDEETKSICRGNQQSYMDHRQYIDNKPPSSNKISLLASVQDWLARKLNNY